MPIIQALDRALQIVDLFDEHTTELKITEISIRMGLHKSTVHSLLKTLMLHGYIGQDADSGKYKLGLKLIEKGQLMLQTLDIRAVAKKNLSELCMRTGQTTHLVILSGKEGVYIDKVEGVKAAIRYSRLGGRVPLHCSAVGKVLAAFQSDEKQRKLLSDYIFTIHTPNTIGDMARFLEELAQVRKQGYAVDNQENEPGVRCVAAPIYDHSRQTIAAISLSTMTTGVNDDEFQLLSDQLIAESIVISKLLGFHAT
ncbi:MAG: IclR family transcriptional regulator [Paenibacillaceae bacterium]